MYVSAAPAFPKPLTLCEKKTKQNLPLASCNSLKPIMVLVSRASLKCIRFGYPVRVVDFPENMGHLEPLCT